ncbi:MAG: LysR family transcriptional regulator [Roseibium sp.]|uniref:LysR family transcriptional regulator n=1 Tax=Roseibium sp. TaxID=1936156 RepID=UPI0026382C3F|nr:LysR family transcriptional regulator [Roseibium sp.]MCV0426490.1 LysR family transcriptional regulator [Roseibium sp.]
MDRLDAMRFFVRVVDRRSFTHAAADLDISRSTATEVIQRLEERLRTRLLERTTRHVSPTPDGEAYYRNCVTILSDIDETERAFLGGEPSGLLRVDAPGPLTRTYLLPELPDFMSRFPEIELQLGQGERLVDLVREGVDCVIRAGDPEESGLIRRALGQIEEITCASPAYLEVHGMPRSPDDLQSHHMIGFVSSRTHTVLPLEFQCGDTVREIKLPCRTKVNDAETAHHLAELGFGLIQAPRYRFRNAINSKKLTQVLASFPPPPLQLAAYYPQRRQLSPRVRVFLDWAADVFARAEI